MPGKRHINRYTLFLRHVDTRGMDPMVCWPWRGASKGNGYGQVGSDGQSITAHRKSYLLFCGPVPDGMDVCHACDNRWCVNPDHLFLGTRLENMADASAKKRMLRQGKKILERDRQEITRLLLLGEDTKKIAMAVGVSYGSVSRVRVAMGQGND
jgi:hypothetical protein